MTRISLALLLMVGAALTAQAQGTFQNLGFESASLVPIPGDPYNRVQFGAAFPGWTAYVGGMQQTGALHNNLFLDSSGVSIIDQNGTNPFGGPGVIQGQFTAVLQAGWALGTFVPADTSLVQTGAVPPTAHSLLFRAYLSAPLDSLAVEVGGQTLSLIALGGGTKRASINKLYKFSRTRLLSAATWTWFEVFGKS